MGNNQNSFLLYLDALDILAELTDEDAGKIFKAIWLYKKEQKIELTGVLKALFIPIKNFLDRDAEKYNQKVEKNRENGKKGGAPKGNKNASKNNPIQPETTENNQAVDLPAEKQPKQADSDSDSDSDSEYLKNIILKEKYKDLITLEWKELIIEWLNYKRSKNQPYCSVKPLEAFIDKLLSLSDSNIETAKAIISESMANNWNGIFALKNQQNIVIQGGNIEHDPCL